MEILLKIKKKQKEKQNKTKQKRKTKQLKCYFVVELPIQNPCNMISKNETKLIFWYKNKSKQIQLQHLFFSPTVSDT